MTTYLRFKDKAAAQVALATWLDVQEDSSAYIGAVAVDVVGLIHRPTGQMLTDEVPEMAALEGFHINLSDRVPELAEFEIDAPAAPARVFLGAV